MKIIFTRGIIGSGKSFWSKQFVKDNQHCKRVNRDDLRHMISSYSYDKDNENLIDILEHNIINQLLTIGYDVIIDRQNLDEIQLSSDMRLYKIKYNAECEVKDFPITLEEAIYRDSKRDFMIGEKVIRKTWKRYSKLLENMLVNKDVN